MIFVPLLHYFKCKNLYSGNEAGMRYLLTPTKRTVPDPEGGEGAEKEEAAVHTPRFCGEEVLIGFFWRELKLL